MPSTVLISITATDQGIAIESLPVKRGNKLEEGLSGIMDKGIKVVQQAMISEITKAIKTEGMQLEGDNIDKAIAANLKSIGADTISKMLKDEGIVGP